MKQEVNCIPDTRQLKAERVIREFCIGKINFVIIDSIFGCKASAIKYSLIENVKPNNVYICKCVKRILSVIPNHMEDNDAKLCEELFPWSVTLLERYRQIVIGNMMIG